MTIFFVLSGFVITMRYYEKFEGETKQIKQFYLARFFRIFPLFCLITLAFFFLQRNFSPWIWFLNFTFLKAFFEDAIYSGIGSAWSLSVEVLFYLVAPWLLVAFRNNKTSMVLLFAFIGILLVLASDWFQWQPFLPDLNFMLEYTIFGQCFVFLCGYQLAQYFKQNPEKTGFFQKNQWFPVTYVGLISVIGCLGLELFFLKNYPVLAFKINADILINNFLLPIAVSYFFYGLITEKTFLYKLFSNKTALLLGNSSYAFYLIQAGMIYEVLYFHLSTNIFILFGALNILAVLLFKFIDEPVHHYLTRKFIHRKIKPVTVEVNV